MHLRAWRQVAIEGGKSSLPTNPPNKPCEVAEIGTRIVKEDYSLIGLTKDTEQTISMYKRRSKQ